MPLLCMVVTLRYSARACICVLHNQTGSRTSARPTRSVLAVTPPTWRMPRRRPKVLLVSMTTRSTTTTSTTTTKRQVASRREREAATALKQNQARRETKAAKASGRRVSLTRRKKHRSTKSLESYRFEVIQKQPLPKTTTMGQQRGDPKATPAIAPTRTPPPAAMTPTWITSQSMLPVRSILFIP
jgi:hypothetical protein